MKKDIVPMIWMGCIFLVSQFLALIVVPTFKAAGMQAFENPSDPTNSMIYILIILGFTAVILLIAKLNLRRLIQCIVLAALFFTMSFILQPIAMMIPLFQIAFYGFTIAHILSISIAILLIAVLYRYPEWYIVDLCGVLVSAGAIAIFGISFDIVPAIILLIGLAVYDFISVYRTKHMLKLADSVLELKLPMMIVIPKQRGYSFIKEGGRITEKEERDAFFMGLGDIVIPGVLVASAYHFTENFYLSMSVLTGALCGFAVLMYLVSKKRAHAGLPLLNGGAILGYVIGSLILQGKIF